MKELDEELWKLGVLSKTKHNEVAPGQHEMAPIYTDANTASDQNQLDHGDDEKGRRAATTLCACCTKSPLRASTARASTTTGRSPPTLAKTCFDPGETPSQNAAVPAVALRAFIKGVDEYQELLRCSVAFAGNDHRLGAQRSAPGHHLRLPRRRA